MCIYGEDKNRWRGEESGISTVPSSHGESKQRPLPRLLYRDTVFKTLQLQKIKIGKPVIRAPGKYITGVNAYMLKTKPTLNISLCVVVAQSCQTLCNPMDSSPLGSSGHGILQARILEWVAIPFSRESSWPRDRTPVFCTAGRFFTIWAPRETHIFHYTVCYTTLFPALPKYGNFYEHILLKKANCIWQFSLFFKSQIESRKSNYWSNIIFTQLWFYHLSVKSEPDSMANQFSHLITLKNLAEH